MALGDTITINSTDSGAIEVLASATVANGAPTGTAGISAEALKAVLGFIPPSFRVAVFSTAGSGTMTVTVRLWGRYGALGWSVIQALNGGAAIAETGTDTIGYSENVLGIGAADRYYLEIVAIAGTSTAVKGEIVVSRSQLL